MITPEVVIGQYTDCYVNINHSKPKYEIVSFGNIIIDNVENWNLDTYPNDEYVITGSYRDCDNIKNYLCFNFHACHDVGYYIGKNCKLVFKRRLGHCETFLYLKID